MASSIQTKDIVWTRNGDPMQVTGKSPETGKLYFENRFDVIQKESKQGVKNGLDPDSKEAVRSIISCVQNNDKHEEINQLYEKIKTLKGQNADPRLIKYLENELQFRIVRETYKPEDYAESPVVIGL